MFIHSSQSQFSHWSIHALNENAKFVEYTPPFEKYLGTYKAPEGNYYEPNIFLHFCTTIEEFERYKAFDQILYSLHEYFWSKDTQISQTIRSMLFSTYQLAINQQRGLTISHYDVRSLRRYSFGGIHISPATNLNRVFIGYTRLYQITTRLNSLGYPSTFCENIPRIPDALLGCEMSCLAPDQNAYQQSVFIPSVDMQKLDIAAINASRLSLDFLITCISGVILFERSRNADAFNW